MRESEELNTQDDTTFTAYWPLFDDDGVTPLNIAGWTARAEIRSRNAELLETFQVSLATGRVELKLEATRRTWQDAVFDIRIQSPSGDVSRPIFGIITNHNSVTR